MAAAGVEEDTAVQAARILLTLRSRRLLRWPEWVEPLPVAATAAAAVEVRWPLEGWPKRQRSARRCPSGGWRPDMAPPELGLFAAASASGSGASSSGEDRERSRWKEEERPRRSRDELMAAPPRRPDSSPAYYVKPAGSGADRKARPRHAVVVDKASAVAKAKASAAAAAAAAPAKEEPMMKASSPETPLDFGSGASSSGDDAARPPSKRRAAPGSGGGGGASSGDEGCTSQDKRARLDAGGDGGVARGEKAISEPKVQAPDDSDKGVKYAFDLNMPCPEDDY